MVVIIRSVVKRSRSTSTKRSRSRSRSYGSSNGGVSTAVTLSTIESTEVPRGRILLDDNLIALANDEDSSYIVSDNNYTN